MLNLLCYILNVIQLSLHNQLIIHDCDHSDQSTMCGHAMMALGRYAVDKGLIPKERLLEPEVMVKVQCPCGLVTLWTEWKDGKSGGVRFHSVPAFAFATGDDRGHRCPQRVN